MAINETNETVVQAGMTFHVRLTLTDLSPKQSRSIIAIGETIVIKKAGEALGALAKEDSDEKKKEIFVKIWSKHTGHDLGPYFATFGWPHTDHMKAFNKGLKPWMPKDFPPKPAKAAAAPRAKSTLFGSRNEAMAGADEVHGDDNPANDH